MFFYNQKPKGEKMSSKELIKEYDEKKKSVQDLEKKLEQSKREIAKFFSDFAEFQRPKDKCVGQYTEEFLSYDEWRYKDTITTIQYCPEFQKQGGCNNVDCPGYQKYGEYLKAKSDYENAEHELWSYPLWVMLMSFLQRKIRR